MTGSYVYLDTSEPDPSSGGRRRVSLAPNYTGGLVGKWEDHDKDRIGVEAYYTGRLVLYGEEVETKFACFVSAPGTK